jgi:hypothetical protein
VFDEDKHKVKAFRPHERWQRAVGIDPFGAYIAAVWVAYDPQANVLNVYREYCEPFGVTVAQHAANIKRETQTEPVFVWVCGAKSERAWRLEWEAAGIPVVEPPIVDVWVGIDRVTQLLRDFNLVVHDNCVGLLSEITDYRRKLDKAGQATETIENKDAYHLLDALRYVVAYLTQPTSEYRVLPRYRIGPDW